MHRLTRRFWSSDAGLTALLILLFLDIFIFYPIVTGTFGKILIQGCFFLIIVSGVRAVVETPVWGRLVLALGGTGLVCGVITFAYPWRSLEVSSTIIEVAFIALLIVVILTHVFREGHIDAHRIAGAVAVYLLIGVLWGKLYSIVAMLSPKAFNFTQSYPSGGIDFIEGKLIYFSFMTLTSVGYGDIFPVHAAAKTAAMLEAVIGQLFPSILLARLVSMEIEARQIKKRKSAKESAPGPS
ncbi:MAG: two pore domain potassium channel family protein [Deltaproteobacteria bacterium]|nr:two pore domain potassium channel family protein [Deltaproteobacteria bacterium]